MPHSLNQLRDLSSLFSRSEVLRWLEQDFISINLKLNRYQTLEKNKGKSYLKFIQKTYYLLRDYYPNEYIVKNEFLNQWLQNEIVNDDAIIFNELRIGKAIADLAVFNGVSKAFEIKTILDKDARLSGQLEEYKKIFNEVYVIVPDQKVCRYLAYDNNIGVISYEEFFGKFKLIRNPIFNRDIDVNTLMNILHTKEYKEIVKMYYETTPNMNSFNQFSVCKELISNIPSTELNNIFLNIMKNRNINNSFFKKDYKELNQLLLSLNMKKEDKEKLIANLKIKII